MIKLQGKVFAVVDETREFNDKDKDGNPTGTKSAHRITNIQMICDEKDHKTQKVLSQFFVLVSGFDLPATFSLPKQGEEWETPYVKSLNAYNPLRIEARI